MHARPRISHGRNTRPSRYEFEEVRIDLIRISGWHDLLDMLERWAALCKNRT